MKRAKTNLYRFNRRRSIGAGLSKITSIILIIVGFLMTLPFAIITFLEINFHQTGIQEMIFLLGMMLGGPMFLMGLVSLFMGDRVVITSSTSNLDLGRIRHVAETNKFTQK